MLHLQPDGTIIINPQEFKGLISPNGQVILPVIYDQVIPVQSRTLEREGNGTIFRVEIGEAIGYFRVKDNQAEEIWELQN